MFQLKHYLFSIDVGTVVCFAIRNCRKLSLIISGQLSLFSFGQFTFNLNHHHDNIIHGSHAVIATDSVFYTLGVGYETFPGKGDLVFSKLDFEGNILEQHNFAHDSLSHDVTNPTTFKISSDGNFIAAVTAYPYKLFYKITPYGDTVFMHVLDTLIDMNIECYGGSDIIEHPEDSTYAIYFYGADAVNGVGVLVKIHESGNVLWVKKYYTNLSDYEQFHPGKFVERNGGGYLLSGIDFFHLAASEEDWRYEVRMIEVDENGNVIANHADTENHYRARPLGLTKTSDGGFLYCAEKGYFLPEYNGHAYFGNIVKLAEDFSIEWELWPNMGEYEVPGGYAGLKDIVQVNETDYLACGGEYYSPEHFAGKIIKFNLDGTLLWDSYFTIVPFNGDITRHEFRCVDVCSDGGYIMAGQTLQPVPMYSGDTIQEGWYVKVDTFGCIVPGCQEVWGIEENCTEISMICYPNPATNVLNVFVNPISYGENITGILYDSNGRKLREWNLAPTEMTYILEISDLQAGNYVVALVSGTEVLTSEKFIKK